MRKTPTTIAAIILATTFATTTPIAANAAPQVGSQIIETPFARTNERTEAIQPAPFPRTNERVGAMKPAGVMCYRVWVTPWFMNIITTGATPNGRYEYRCQ